MRLFALVFLRLKRFLSWFLSSFRQRAFCSPIFNRTLRRTSMYVHVARGPTNKFKSHGQSYEGGVTKGGQNNNNNHTTNHIANCLVVLAIWEDALVIVVCYTWVLAAFSFLLSAALIEYYFWHVLRLAAFCVVPWPKIKADIIQKQTRSTKCRQWIWRAHLNFAQGGEDGEGVREGLLAKRNKHFLCAIKVPLLLIPSPLSPTCYSFASPFLAINSLHKFRLCCIIKKLNSFFLYLSLSFFFECNLDFFNLELEWKLFARLMRSRLAALSLELSQAGGGAGGGGESWTDLKIYSPSDLLQFSVLVFCWRKSLCR